MKTTLHTTYIYCLSHDTKEAFIVDTITGRTKETSLKKASDLCQRYNNEWGIDGRIKISAISYCVSDKLDVEYDILVKQMSLKRKTRSKT